MEPLSETGVVLNVRQVSRLEAVGHALVDGDVLTWIEVALGDELHGVDIPIPEDWARHVREGMKVQVRVITE